MFSLSELFVSRVLSFHVYSSSRQVVASQTSSYARREFAGTNVVAYLPGTEPSYDFESIVLMVSASEVFGQLDCCFRAFGIELLRERL